MKFNTLFSHTGFAVNITSVFLSVAMTMSGILSINMPGFLQGVNYLSPIRYAVRNLVPYSLRGINFTCNAEQRLPDGSCTISTGTDVLNLWNLNVNPLVNILALGATALIYRLLAYALLRLRRSHWREWWVGKFSRKKA